MKRISGGQLSREAKATLLSSHAGGPRTAAGDKTFVGQTKAADTVVKSQPAASRRTYRSGRTSPSTTTEHFDSESLSRFDRGRVPLSERGQPATAASGASWLVRWTSGSLAVVGCPPRWTAVICRAAHGVGLCLRVLCAAGGWWRCWPAGCAPCCWSERAQPGRVRGWRRHQPRALGSFGRVAGSGCSARGCGFRWNGRTLGVLRSRWL